MFEACDFIIDSPIAKNKAVDLIAYVVMKLFDFLQKKYANILIIKLVRLYELVMMNCFVKTSSLCCVTRLLSDKMYAGQLTAMDIKYAYDLLGKAGFGYRLKSDSYRGNLQPYLYFDGSAKVGFRVLLTSNKWPFSKGMHLCVWFKALGGGSGGAIPSMTSPPSSPNKKPQQRKTTKKADQYFRSIILEIKTE